MKINPQKEAEAIVRFLQSTFKTQSFNKAIMAVSGGVDSAVALSLTVKALSPDNVFSIQLPYKRQSTYLSNLIIDQLQLLNNQRLIINLSQPIDKLSLKLNAKKDQTRLGNIMARTRMICLFDQAKKNQSLVVGTENKSERLLGYYTRFGDAASDLEPLSHLYKTQVYQLAQFLKIPEKIISSPPSANLWPDQTDEAELGFSYSQADPILHLLIDKKLSPQAVINQGFDKALVKKIQARLSLIDFKSKVPYHL